MKKGSSDLEISVRPSYFTLVDSPFHFGTGFFFGGGLSLPEFISVISDGSSVCAVASNNFSFSLQFSDSFVFMGYQ